MRRFEARAIAGIVTLAWAGATMGCAAGAPDRAPGGEAPPDEGGVAEGGPAPSAPPAPGFEAGGAPAPKGEIYAHSDTALYRIDEVAEVAHLVGTFDCVEIAVEKMGLGMWDIAIDAAGNITGTTARLERGKISGSLVSIDKKTAHCEVTAVDVYPNSLSFLPAGTLDPVSEALVGFEGDTYVRIDPASGDKTVIGSLNPNPTGKSWTSSGDVVSIIGEGTYLTVKPHDTPYDYAGPDTLVEIDPLTGRVLAVVASTGVPQLWGLGYWGGKAYGFSATAELVRIDLASGATEMVSLANAASFWGAGTSTAAPVDTPE
jgi:hypothetical protein